MVDSVRYDKIIKMRKRLEIDGVFLARGIDSYTRRRILRMVSELVEALPDFRSEIMADARTESGGWWEEAVRMALHDPGPGVVIVGRRYPDMVNGCAYCEFDPCGCGGFNQSHATACPFCELSECMCGGKEWLKNL